MKIQVWFRPDQAELVVSCLGFVMRRLNEDHASGAHKHVSGPFTYQRLQEIIDLIQGSPDAALREESK